jgi:PAS domain-containing protein
VILHHHHPSEAALPERRRFLLTGVVALANNLCYSQNIGSGADPAGAMLPPYMFKSLGIHRVMIKQAIQQGPMQLREMAGRIDWEPVTRDAFHVALERASRPATAVEAEPEAGAPPAPPLSSAPRDTRDLQGLNAIGLALAKCDSLEYATGAVAGGLVSSFSFSRAVCCAYHDDQWEYRAEASPSEDGCVCQTEFAERSPAEEVLPDAGAEGSWLHIELNGKGKVLGCIKVKPGTQSDMPLEVQGLVLASCAKLAAQALERIRYELRAQHLSENHTHEILWLKQEKEIAESERTQKENILQCLPIGIVLLEQDGRIEFINSEARGLLGLQQPLGRKRLQEVFKIPGLQEALESALRGSSTAGREFTPAGPAAPLGRRVRWRLMPLRDGRDQPTGQFLLVLGDLTADRTASMQILTSGPLTSVPKLLTGTV